MKERNISTLQQIREARGLSRKELSEKSGINFRSLQDYEQGHKDIASAKGDTLYKLSLALGCNMEDLLISRAEESTQRNRLQTYYQMLIKTKLAKIEGENFYSKKYETYAKLKVEENNCNLIFCYQGEIVKLPFETRITEETLPWIEDVAILMIDSYLKNRIFEEKYSLEGDVWHEP